ncbi:ribosomal protein L29 [Cenarchaeum symbiosum A]|uniref:Large ribosomal subunit protein uL29 n=1 Tax=Cenarchaeum symbiosum (strain A) TaxID=414004 RepID=A0RVY0_CENSY|nr:ribosomal protein L29 [Cenarchaeum symbiosum A]
MTRTRMKTVRSFNEGDLRDRIQQARSDLAKLRVDSSKGTLRKNSGKIRPLRRDIARMMTRLAEMER